MQNEKTIVLYLFVQFIHSFIHSFIHFFIIIVVLVAVYSCTEKQTPEPESIKQNNTSLQKTTIQDQVNYVVKDTTKGNKKDSLKFGGGIIVQPNAQSSCYKVVDSWELDHYEAVPGKIVGIWPTEERWGSINRLKQLKDTLGFNYILTTLGWPYDNCYAAGYRPNNMLGGGLDVVIGGYATAVQSRPTLWGYYTDEPITNHGASAQYYMSTATQWFSQNYPNSLFISGETEPSLADYIVNYVNVLMCTRYCVDGEFCLYPDQRPLWTSFRTNYGNKFSMCWIGAHKDLSQYDELVGHATGLGLQAIWLYQYQDDTDSYSNSNLNAYTFFAWKWGWLRRFERRWVYTYRCLNQNPCDCDPNGLAGGWIVQSKYATSDIRETTY